MFAQRRGNNQLKWHQPNQLNQLLEMTADSKKKNTIKDGLGMEVWKREIAKYQFQFSNNFLTK